MDTETIADILAEMREDVREALEKAEQTIEELVALYIEEHTAAIKCGAKWEQDDLSAVNAVLDMCRAALSAPARNCDRFECAEEAWIHYCDEQGQASDRSWKALILFGKWLFAKEETKP